MISKARIYLTADRSRAVPAGDKDARSLLVIEGGEISDATLAKYPGAAELAGGQKPESPKGALPKDPEPPEIEHREPVITHRDPLHKPKHR